MAAAQLVRLRVTDDQVARLLRIREALERAGRRLTVNEVAELVLVRGLAQLEKEIRR